MNKYTKNYKKTSFKTYEKSSHFRNIGLGIKLKVFLSGFNVFFGGIFFFIGMFSTIVFMSQMSLKDIRFSENSPTTKGTITNISGTSNYVNEKQVYKYSYNYKVNSIEYQGESFKIGYQKIEEVEIEYLESNHSVSRIKGMKTSSFPLWIIGFLLIFPIVGAAIMLIGVRKNIKYIRILSIGRVTFGVFSHMETTGASVNKQPVFRMFFNYVTHDNVSAQAYGETYQIYKLQDEQIEPLVYNPSNPSEAIMIDALPKIVRKLLNNEIEEEKRRIEIENKKVESNN